VWLRDLHDASYSGTSLPLPAHQWVLIHKIYFRCGSENLSGTVARVPLRSGRLVTSFTLTFFLLCVLSLQILSRIIDHCGLAAMFSNFSPQFTLIGVLQLVALTLALKIPAHICRNGASSTNMTVNYTTPPYCTLRFPSTNTIINNA